MNRTVNYSAFIRISVYIVYWSVNVSYKRKKTLSGYAESRGIFVFFELKSKLQTDIVDYEHGFPVCWRACTRRKNFDWTKTRESIDDRRDFALLNCGSRPSSPTIRYDDASSRDRRATHQVRVKKSQEFFFNLSFDTIALSPSSSPPPPLKFASPFRIQGS